MKSIYRRTALPAAVLATGLFAGCSSGGGEQIAQPSDTPAATGGYPSAEATQPSASLISTAPRSTEITPPLATTTDSNGDRVAIARLTPNEQSLYDEFNKEVGPSPQAIALRAVTYVCEARTASLPTARSGKNESYLGALTSSQQTIGQHIFTIAQLEGGLTANAVPDFSDRLDQICPIPPDQIPHGGPSGSG